MIWKYTHSAEYMDLVGQFPLTVIKTRAQHEQAMAMLEKLAVKATMGKAESDYFDVLSKLVKDYEDATTTTVQVTPQEALSFVMDQTGLNHRNIAKLTGMQESHISEFFAGKRNLPKHAAAKLGALFRVDPMTFLPKVEPAKTGVRIAKQALETKTATVAKAAKAKTLTKRKMAASSKKKGLRRA